MTPLSNTDPRFPTGTFHFNPDVTSEMRRGAIAAIRETPAKLRAATRGLTDTQLDTPYREGGWTVRQLIHHVPESHVNAFVRFKLALTEERTTIKPYDESRWSLLADAQRAGVEPSLRLLEGLHARWLYLLRSLAPDAFNRSFYHPENQEVVPLWHALAYYAWHARHHTAQIEWVKKHRLPALGGR